MSDLLRCRACGGAVVWDAAHSGAACLYCATVALELDPRADLPEPDVYLSPQITAEAADASFRTWSRSSWFRPKALADAELGLRLMLLPAWRFDARLETHWAGLRIAATRSGKTPATGVDHADMRHLVVASGGLSQAELAALTPFDEDGAQAWTGTVDGEVPIWEPPALTRRGARARAHRGLSARHSQRLGREHQLARIRVSPLIEDRDVRLMLVPIYIGSFRFDERAWRLLINAQTGKVVGDAPLDRRKVAAVVAAALALTAVLIALFVWLGTR